MNDQIAAINRKLEEAVAAGDPASAAALYHPEAKLFTNGADPLEGISAIQSFFQSAKDGGITKVELTTLELEVFGDTAIEIGKAALFVREDQLVARDNYSVIWKKSGGEWKLFRDLISPGPPVG